MAEGKDPWGTKALGQALSMATNMAAALFVGYFSGHYLDKFFDTDPWFTIIMFLLGMGAGMKMMYEAAFGRIGSKNDSGEGDEGEKKFKLKDSLTNLKDAKQKLKEDRQRLLREKWVEEYRNQKDDDEGTGPRS